MFNMWSVFDGEKSKCIDLFDCYSVENFMGDAYWNVLFIGCGKL
jgi:hypothetical protein